MAHLMTSSVVITARVSGLASVSPAKRRETNRRSPKIMEIMEIIPNVKERLEVFPCSQHSFSHRQRMSC